MANDVILFGKDVSLELGSVKTQDYNNLKINETPAIKYLRSIQDPGFLFLEKANKKTDVGNFFLTKGDTFATIAGAAAAIGLTVGTGGAAAPVAPAIVGGATMAGSGAVQGEKQALTQTSLRIKEFYEKPQNAILQNAGGFSLTQGQVLTYGIGILFIVLLIYVVSKK